MAAETAGQLQFQEGSLNDGGGQLALPDDFVNLDRRRAQRRQHPMARRSERGFVSGRHNFSIIISLLDAVGAIRGTAGKRPGQAREDIGGAFGQGGPLADQVVRPAAPWVERRTWNGKYLPAVFNRQSGGD
jgi:hypothetical protein